MYGGYGRVDQEEGGVSFMSTTFFCITWIEGVVSSSSSVDGCGTGGNIFQEDPNKSGGV